MAPFVQIFQGHFGLIYEDFTYSIHSIHWFTTAWSFRCFSFFGILDKRCQAYSFGTFISVALRLFFFHFPSFSSTLYVLRACDIVNSDLFVQIGRRHGQLQLHC